MDTIKSNSEFRKRDLVIIRGLALVLILMLCYLVYTQLKILQHLKSTDFPIDSSSYIAIFIVMDVLLLLSGIKLWMVKKSGWVIANFIFIFIFLLVFFKGINSITPPTPSQDSFQVLKKNYYGTPFLFLFALALPGLVTWHLNKPTIVKLFGLTFKAQAICLAAIVALFCIFIIFK